MVSSTTPAVALRALPAASIRLISAGVTLSLKRNCTVFGACAKTLPSAGSVETSEACADTPVAKHKTDSNVARPAIRRIVRPYGFEINLTAGAGDLLSWAPASPSAGISIQRLIPCSHSCTTGKYRLVFGL